MTILIFGFNKSVPPMSPCGSISLSDSMNPLGSMSPLGSYFIKPVGWDAMNTSYPISLSLDTMTQ